MPRINWPVLTVTYGTAFFLSFAIEIPVLFLFRRFGLFTATAKRTVAAGVVAQCLTHPLFILVVPLLTILSRPEVPFILQVFDPIWSRELIFIPLIEAAWYWFFLRPKRWWQPLVLSYGANLVSWGLGYLVPWGFIAGLVK
jgi:hypothetical protein